MLDFCHDAPTQKTKNADRDITISFRTHWVSKFRFYLQKLALTISTVLLFIPLFVIAGDPISLDTIPPPLPDPFFYFGQDYGSESQFGALNVFLNVGFVTTGRMTQSPRFSDIDFNRNGTILFNSLFHQRHAINEDYDNGLTGFFTSEFVPSYLPAIPNYLLHFVGEGMLSRKLEEYYQSRGFQGIWPKVLSISAVVASQQVNELVEFGYVLHPKSDPVADLYFNTAGIVAFSLDSIAKLFSNEWVRLYYWPGQPVVDIRDSGLFNHGETYLLRTTLGSRTDWKFALLFGLPTNGLGVSIPLENGDNLTIMPLATDQLIRPRGYETPTREELLTQLNGDDLDQKVSHDLVIKEFNYSVNLYWDRSGSLLASLAICYEPEFNLSLNVYPSVMSVGPVGVGGYLVASQNGASTVGMTLSVSPVVLGTRF
ncbi:MAG: hypothetical protein HQ510_11055 [Candidatus Marinimicrobia bacterium]|nr:hypothetical protein [Candidatus Neomarinimicrobiota bacterium]